MGVVFSLQNAAGSQFTSWSLSYPTATVAYGQTALAPVGISDQATVDGWRLDVSAPTSSGSIHVDLLELVMYAVWCAVPTVTVGGPSGTITTASPTLSWTHTGDVDADAGGTQARYRVKVFTAAQYTAAGFTPDAAADYDTLDVVTTATTRVIGPFPDAVTYKAYVATAQNVNGAPHWSAWTAGSTFLTNTDPPQVASIVAGTTIDDSPPVGNMLTNPGFETGAAPGTGWSLLSTTVYGTPTSSASTMETTGGESGRYLHQTSTLPATASYGVEQSGVPVVPGRRYELSVRLRATVTAGLGAVLVLHWRDTAGVLVSYDYTAIPTPASSWTTYTVAGIAPLGAVTATPHVRLQPAGGVGPSWSGTLDVDNMSMTSAGPTANSVVTITVTRDLAHTAWTHVQVERSTDAMDWVPIRGALAVAEDTETVTVDDYEMPEGVDLWYRARGLVRSADGTTTASGPWAVTTSPVVWRVADTGCGEWMRSPAAPDGGVIVELVVDDATVTTEHRVGLLDVIGRASPVTVWDTPSLGAGEMTVVTRSFDDAAALQSLLRTAPVVLYQGRFDWGHPYRWMAVTGHATSRIPSPDPQFRDYRQWTITYVEVDAPAVLS
jgi:hypothetical protein